jgi:hypothetical protein
MQQLLQENEVMDVPLCGGNLSTVVLNRAEYINEISYSIGPLNYIENAD